MIEIVHVGTFEDRVASSPGLAQLPNVHTGCVRAFDIRIEHRSSRLDDAVENLRTGIPEAAGGTGELTRLGEVDDVDQVHAIIGEMLKCELERSIGLGLPI